MINKPGQLVLWFSRLNRFFTIPNLVIHLESQEHQKGHRQGTDIDAIGVRFPFRKELKDTDKCAEDLTSKGICEDENLCICLCLISDEKNSETLFPEALKISREDVTKFISKRFDYFKLQKSFHPQSEEVGQSLLTRNS